MSNSSFSHNNNAYLVIYVDSHIYKISVNLLLGSHISKDQISVITDVSVLRFYRYIENIGEISIDILTKISVKRKLTIIL